MKEDLGLLVFSLTILGTYSLELVNQWNFVTYDFPSDFDYQAFKPENTVMTGIEITDKRIFIGLPSIRSGVPAVLASIPRHTPPGSSPVLQAYPNWSFHRGSSTNVSCSGLASVYRMRTDSCNRLWVLDAGIMTSIETFRRVCQPKLIAFDLSTDQVVRTVLLPDDVLRPASVLTNFIIDESIQGKCDSAFFYISDSVAPGLIVHDGKTDKSWRFSDPSMYPNPDHSSFNIVGDTFTFMDGIIGLTFAPQLGTVFYQALATDRIYSVPTSALIKGPPGELDELPISVVGRKSSQGLALAVNYVDNTLYFSPFTETSIASWNIATNENRVLAHDPTSLQFTADLRWKEDDSLWILSTRFNRFFKRTVTPNEINLRLMRIHPTSPIYSHFLNNRFYY